MRGPGIQPNHAYFKNKGGNIYLIPQSEEAINYIKVNGKDIGKGVKLQNNDRIVFGVSTIFIFIQSREYEDLTINYEKAQDEVNSTQKEQQKKKIEEEKRKEEAKIKELEEKFELEKKEAEIQQQAEKEERERKIKELEEKLKTQQAEKERKKAKDQKLAIEEEVKKREEDIKLANLKASEKNRKQIKIYRNKIEESARLEEVLDTLLPMIKEANISAEKLKRNILFKPIIIHELDERSGLTPIEKLRNSKSVLKVKIYNKEEGTEYLWDPDKF